MTGVPFPKILAHSWYHGTPYDIPVGDFVLPAAAILRVTHDNSPDPARSHNLERVFITPYRSVATLYAGIDPRPSAEPFSGQHVYKVLPYGYVVPDTEAPYVQFHCAYARVLGVETRDYRRHTGDDYERFKTALWVSLRDEEDENKRLPLMNLLAEIKAWERMPREVSAHSANGL